MHPFISSSSTCNTQTILSSTLSLPFSLSSLLLAKAAVIRILHSLASTHICNSLLILSATAASFSLLAAMLSLSSPRFRLLFSAAGVIAYSITLASVYSLHRLPPRADHRRCGGGFSWTVEACVLIRGWSSAALSLAAAMNVALAAVEALFQYRVINA